MRITNRMLTNDFINNIRVNLTNMQKLQQQMTSGKEISKPSDDPFKVSRAMAITTNINTNNQYNTNIGDTINWLDTTDTSLGQAESSFQRIRELLVSAGNGSYSQSERGAIKDEINQKIGELAQSLNTNFDGKYVFGGSRGTVRPVETVQDLNLSSNVVAGVTAQGGVTGNFTGKSGDAYVVTITGVDDSAATTPGKVTGITFTLNGVASSVIPTTIPSSDPPAYDLGNGLIFHANTDAVNNVVGQTVSFNGEDLEKDGNTKLVYYSNNASNPELIDANNPGELNKIKKSLNVEVSQGVNLAYNNTAADVLQYKNDAGTAIDLRQVLSSIVNHLDGKNANGTTVTTTDKDPVTELTGSDLDAITGVINNLLKLRAEVGAKQNRMTSAKDKNETENINLTQILSKTEDIDITEKMMQYATAQTIYTASLQTSAKIIQPSLLDYLR